MPQEIIGYQAWMRCKTNNIFRETWRYKKAVGKVQETRAEATRDVSTYCLYNALNHNERVEVRELKK